MVWARTKLVIFDDLFDRPEEQYFNYSGPHPTKFYHKVQDLLFTIFKIPKSNLQEIEYTWETPKPGTTRCKCWWRMVKQMDIYTYIRVDLILDGSEVDGKGPMRITIKPAIITEYPQDTLVQQSIFYELFRRFWHTVFYHKKRMEYLQVGRELVTKYEEAVKAFGEELRKHANN